MKSIHVLLLIATAQLRPFAKRSCRNVRKVTMNSTGDSLEALTGMRKCVFHAHSGGTSNLLHSMDDYRVRDSEQVVETQHHSYVSANGGLSTPFSHEKKIRNLWFHFV